jgi:hypothetical protein
LASQRSESPEVVIRGGRLYWPGRPGAPAVEQDPALPSTSWLETARNNVVLVTVFLYLLLNWGFQQVRIPPVEGGGLPVGEIVLFMSLATVNYTRAFGVMSRAVYLLPFLVWWGFGVGRAMVDFSLHGMWALRDAAHVLESLFLIVGFVFASDPRYTEKLFDWLPKFLFIAVIYGALFPFRDLIWSISPTIVAGNGYEVPVLGSMANTALLLIVAAVYLMLFHGNRMLANVAAVLILGYTIAVFQARTLYLVVIAVFLFVGFHRRATIGNMGLLFYLALLMVAFITISGIQIQGRIGETFSAEFLWQHFLAIFGMSGGESEGLRSAEEGIGQRIGWWLGIFARLTESPYSFLLGLGYGDPLTDFSAPEGVVVREPHNSYVTIIGRTGIVGAIAWLSLMTGLVTCWFRSFHLARGLGWRQGENRLLILMVYLISIYILAFTQDALEKPYNIIPFYFFWGVILRMCVQLERGEIGPPPERHALPAEAASFFR